MCVNRLLVVSYFYPPCAAVGALRPARLARHLPEFGWEPIVLTARLPGFERQDPQVIETPCRDVLGEWKARLHLDPHHGLHEQLCLPLATKPNGHRLHTQIINWGKALITFPDAMRGWTPYALDALTELVSGEHIDAILSTSPPISCHIIAAHAKPALRCRWIADYRDLWGGGYIKQRYERTVLRNADALVTVSAPLADTLQRENPDKPVSWITNSFEPDELPVDRASRADLFTITYTGELYKGKRDPTLLLEVLQELVCKGLLPADEVRVRFYGPQEPFLNEVIRRLGLGKVVTTHDRVSHEQALALQAESHLLLLLDWNVPGERGIYTAKVFEYLGMNRPILALGPNRDGVIAELLRETSAGCFFTSKDELRPFLLQCYREWRCSGHVHYEGRRAVIDRYTSRTMAKKFADLLDRVALGVGNQSSSKICEEVQCGD
jgi:glycosyltransferase involved in cell wall biosynthesis